MNKLSNHILKNKFHSEIPFNLSSKIFESYSRGTTCQCYQKVYLELNDKNKIKELNFYTTGCNKKCILNKTNHLIKIKMINKNILDF